MFPDIERVTQLKWKDKKNTLIFDIYSVIRMTDSVNKTGAGSLVGKSPLPAIFTPLQTPKFTMPLLLNQYCD